MHLLHFPFLVFINEWSVMIIQILLKRTATGYVVDLIFNFDKENAMTQRQLNWVVRRLIHGGWRPNWYSAQIFQIAPIIRARNERNYFFTLPLTNSQAKTKLTYYDVKTSWMTFGTQIKLLTLLECVLRVEEVIRSLPGQVYASVQPSRRRSQGRPGRDLSIRWVKTTIVWELRDSAVN